MKKKIKKTSNKTHNQSKNRSDFWRMFVRCGIAGWCLEVMFTSICSLFQQDFRMMAHTSFLMFPIYGMGAFLHPIAQKVDQWVDEPYRLVTEWREEEYPLVKTIRHGLLFMVLIFVAEYVSGILLRTIGICPWDYSGLPTNIDGVIRLDFAPLWFFAGLFLERITQKASMQSA